MTQGDDVLETIVDLQQYISDKEETLNISFTSADKNVAKTVVKEINSAYCAGLNGVKKCMYRSEEELVRYFLMKLPVSTSRRLCGFGDRFDRVAAKEVFEAYRAGWNDRRNIRKRK